MTRNAITQDPGTSGPQSRRDQLLLIATRLIASRGYSATTVRDIADEAGILSGSLYHHFTSKEAIIEEILRSFLDGLLARFQTVADAGLDPRETFDGLIAIAFSTVDSQPDAVALYQNESSFLLRQQGFEFVAEKGQQIEGIWIGALRAGQEAGVFRAEFEVRLIYRFIRDAVWATVKWYRHGGRNTVETVRDEYLALLHNGMLDPGSAPSH
jgi:AcrR family transcriptional regulator